ncbi:MAG: FkbM family methyltransferase [Candidatus Andersenbacteria bacterium]
MSYSQNKEDLLVLDYFGNYKSALLSIGENSGTVLSNALLLIENGWSACLVEPAPIAFEKLQELHKGNSKVQCLNYAITDKVGTMKFFDSDSHISSDDTSLLSTLVESETHKWKATQKFNEIEVYCIDFKTLLHYSIYKTFEFISIDCEGQDVTVLKQIDLNKVGCKCLCIEWNSNPAVKKEIMDYCYDFGMTNIILENAENLLIAHE